jgi:SAM-dependent methyltransferase
MSASTPYQRLRRDFADARHSFGGPLLPRIPPSERTWLRRGAEALFRSDPVQRARGGAADALDRLRGRHDPDLPPRRLQVAVGGGDYREIGREYKRLFVELGGLEPGHDVLEVGSGSGRMAFALGGWLRGRYEGFDVMPEAVEWCQANISTRHPNFNFRVADLRSERYNPGGRHEAADYRFPYDDASFDFAYLTSVFTHLLRPAVENYLAELARVLRPGGRLFATYLLVDAEAERLLGGRGQFEHDVGDALVVDARVPERAVAYRDEVVRELHERSGLPIEAVHHGSWAGRKPHTSFQDITVSVRR